MKKRFVKIGDKLYRAVQDVALISNFQDTDTMTAEDLEKYPQGENLDGLIISGYEMKWGVTNENGERYAETAFDSFINDYFVARELNMPVDINHEGYMNYHAICGRVLTLERNAEGFHFTIYVPRKYEDYDALVWRLQNGIIQGFSKEGYATDIEPIADDNGKWVYDLIKEMKLISVSLVSTPANGVAFDKMQDIKNGLQYIVKDVEEQPTAKGSPLEAMFNK